MGSIFYFFIIVFLFVYSGLNYYVGIRLWHYTSRIFPFMNPIEYWIILGFLMFSYILGRFLKPYFPFVLTGFLKYIGSYWMGVFFYLLLFFVAFDVASLVGKLIGLNILFAQDSITKIIAFIIPTILLIILIYGWWNAKNPVITRYQVNISKKAGALKKLNIVMASDLHLGIINNKLRLQRFTTMVKELEPDLILLTGDIIDEDIRPFIEQQMERAFHQLNPKYGIYGVLGNHEYIGGHVKDTIHYFKEAGIKILRDEYFFVDNSFYIAGRDDAAKERIEGNKRPPYSEWLEGIDKSFPIILMNHQPVELNEAEGMGVDLMVAGHTHRGQLFPNNYITSFIFENDWGHIKKGNMHIIVTTGFGTWGPPIRIGNKPEITLINIKFNG